MTIEDLNKLVDAEVAILSVKNKEVYYEDTIYLTDNCVKQFKVYYSGWECDNIAWIMEDGTIFSSDQGSVTIMTQLHFDTYRNEMLEVSTNLTELDAFITRLKQFEEEK